MSKSGVQSKGFERKRSKLAVRALLSLLFGGGLVYLAFHDLDWPGLKTALKEADYFWLIPYFGSLAAIQIVRAWRWRYLLEPIAPRMPSSWRILTVSWVGFMAIIALPLRLGEMVRPYLISDPAPAKGKKGQKDSGKRLRMSAALGTIAVERVVDGLIVSIFLFVVFLFLRHQGRGPSWMMAMRRHRAVTSLTMWVDSRITMSPASSASRFWKR